VIDVALTSRERSALSFEAELSSTPQAHTAKPNLVRFCHLRISIPRSVTQHSPNLAPCVNESMTLRTFEPGWTSPTQISHRGVALAPSMVLATLGPSSTLLRPPRHSLLD